MPRGLIARIMRTCTRRSWRWQRLHVCPMALVTRAEREERKEREEREEREERPELKGPRASLPARLQLN